jgi:hypothetical protein
MEYEECLLRRRNDSSCKGNGSMQITLSGSSGAQEGEETTWKT